MTPATGVTAAELAPGVPSEARLRRLTHFLRSRREALRPEEVAIPVLGRRRAPGLRREELAGMAGVSVTWYTWLEQGREFKPSRQVLTAIGRALQLDAEETDHLLALGGFPPLDLDREPKAPDPAVLRVLEAWTVGPAHITDARFDVLAGNDPCRQAFGGFADDGDPDSEVRSYLKWLFVGAGRDAIVDWSEDARRPYGVFRQFADRHATEPVQASPSFYHQARIEANAITTSAGAGPDAVQPRTA